MLIPLLLLSMLQNKICEAPFDTVTNVWSVCMRAGISDDTRENVVVRGYHDTRESDAVDTSAQSTGAMLRIFEVLTRSVRQRVLPHDASLIHPAPRYLAFTTDTRYADTTRPQAHSSPAIPPILRI